MHGRPHAITITDSKESVVEGLRFVQSQMCLRGSEVLTARYFLKWEDTQGDKDPVRRRDDWQGQSEWCPIGDSTDRARSAALPEVRHSHLLGIISCDTPTLTLDATGTTQRDGRQHLYTLTKDTTQPIWSIWMVVVQTESVFSTVNVF